MPQTRHIEHHFTASDTVRDIVIGMADGLTVPFSLAAGLSGPAMATRIVVTAGFAGSAPVRSALQTLLVGGMAAAAAFLIARTIA
ncbi:MAG TPA: VIT1/CCC1 transporter family protein [Geothrix sp.]